MMNKVRAVVGWLAAAAITIICCIPAMLIFGVPAAVVVSALLPRANAQVTTPGLRMVPLGYCQLTSVGSSTLLSACSGGIPVGSAMAFIEAEAQAIRYRDDGVAPSATVGMPIAVGGSLLYAGTLTAMRVIEQTSGAKVNVLFYR